MPGECSGSNHTVFPDMCGVALGLSDYSDCCCSDCVLQKTESNVASFRKNGLQGRLCFDLLKGKVFSCRDQSYITFFNMISAGAGVRRVDTKSYYINMYCIGSGGNMAISLL